MVTVFFCSACGDTERVQSCTGRRRLNSSSLDNVYKLLESVIANKVAQSNILGSFMMAMSGVTTTTMDGSS